jgi:AraC family transcriptional regulator of adaptative response / DNA-3-methyladenine glycosylase II
MDEKPDAYFRNIIARRDPRYDGRFYFGVKTTYIYCRPVCPAKPKPENIVIFRSPSEAERAGYRACLRCHPDLAPGTKRVNDAEQRVSQALRIIQSRSDGPLTVGTLAASLRITDRHLRRIFEEHLGASPWETLNTQRLHFAKQMIQETPASMTDIAFAAGFQSIRQFNDAFKESYRTSPTSFRKRGSARGVAGALSLKVPVRLPYDWNYVLAYLKRHETYGLEWVEKNRYRRVVPRGKTFGMITVSHLPGRDYLTADFRNVPLGDIRRLLGRVKNLFDTDHNPLHLPRSDSHATEGIRVPGSFDPFETSVSIILAQVVSTEHAKQKLKKLVCRYGDRIGEDEGHAVYAFPSPRTLALADVKILGLPRARARAVSELARGVWKKAVDFNACADLSKM